MARQSESSIYLDGPWSHRSVSANGTRFHIAEHGEGPLVLLLHGFPEFWWTWRRQLSSLSAAGYRVVAPDLRGYGGSDKPPRGYDLVTAASDAATSASAATWFCSAISRSSVLVEPATNWLLAISKA